MKKYVFAILVIAALSLALSGCGSVSVSINPSSSPTAGLQAQAARQTLVCKRKHRVVRRIMV